VRLCMPAAPIRALAGEMSTLLLDGQNAVPRAALAAGYRFRFAALGGALAALRHGDQGFDRLSPNGVGPVTPAAPARPSNPPR